MDPETSGPRPPAAPAPAPAKERTLTIGAVCKQLAQEFPDISISKIRYLEDQKLLAPRRTPGGYRQYTSGDVARLRAILRMQRDEFLPLRVIRQELAAGRADGTTAVTAPGDTPAPPAPRRTRLSIREPATLHPVREVLEDTGAPEGLVRELEEYGLINGQVKDGVRHYDDTEREIIRAVGELAHYGVAGRNVRLFRTSADREAVLLQQILAPALRSRNPERRREAIDALEQLAATASHLKHLLLVRDLRRVVGQG